MTPKEAADALSKDDITSAIRILEEIYAARGVSDEEKNVIDLVLSAFHHYQLQNRQGRFYDQVEYLVRSRQA